MPPEAPAAVVEQQPATYTVRSGDQLGVIAQRHGIATADLARWNNIANANLITVGQVLRLTPPPATPAPTPPPATPSAGSKEEIEGLLKQIADLTTEARMKNSRRAA
jgi:lipoprotein NlpD